MSTHYVNNRLQGNQPAKMYLTLMHRPSASNPFCMPLSRHRVTAHAQNEYPTNHSKKKQKKNHCVGPAPTDSFPKVKIVKTASRLPHFEKKAKRRREDSCFDNETAENCLEFKWLRNDAVCQQTLIAVRRAKIRNRRTPNGHGPADNNQKRARARQIW